MTNWPLIRTAKVAMGGAAQGSAVWRSRAQKKRCQRMGKINAVSVVFQAMDVGCGRGMRC
jgi:hypothetical protein